jgi:hypothetical protein
MRHMIRSVGIDDVTGVWKLVIESGPEELLLNLSNESATLTGQVSGRRMGTIGISNATISGNAVSWVVPVLTPIAIDLAFSVQVDGDTIVGESRAGNYGTSVVRGHRGTASEWVAWPGPHVHRSAVCLPDGTQVIAVSYDENDPYRRDRSPDFGLYLDRRWMPAWPHAHLEWPDLGLPAQPAAIVPDLHDLLDRARSGQRVEIGCLGGHGRTGTALGWLAVLTGEPSQSAVSWVRANYCPLAVETQEQEGFVARLHP